MDGMSKHALVVYESMYGNTRAIAQALGEGLAAELTVRVVPVGSVVAADVMAADFVVVGAPIHAWGLSRASTRTAAADAAAKPGSELRMEPGWDVGPWVRDWLAGLSGLTGQGAAFDTRLRAPLGLSGSAARKIARGLRRAGLDVREPVRAFYVTKQNRLRPGELDRARAWGRQLAAGVSATSRTAARR